MPRSAPATRQRILDQSAVIVANESLSNLHLERISAEAGVTKKTFYAHFPSKDHFLAALVEHQRPRYLDRYRMWAESCGEHATMREKITRIFKGITDAANNPAWKGSCFIRLAAELGNLPGHPVHAIVAKAAADMEDWFTAELAKSGYTSPASIARQLSVLINGLLMMQLITRNPDYGSDIQRLVELAIPERPEMT